MFALSSARSRAIAAGALGLLLLAGVSTTAAVDRGPGVTLWLSIGLSTAAFVAVATTVTVVILSTIRPLAALRASARAITAGDPQATAKVSGPEEVASLARDFNAMTDALAAKAKEYIDTTNLTGVTLLRVDKDNRVTFLNDAMCQFLGKSREEILGTPIVEYLHPGDVASTTEAVRQMARSKRLARGIMSRYITPMGTRVTEWNGYPIFDEEGRYAGVHGTGRDITERKRAEDALRESEERLRSLFEASPDAIILSDLNTNIIMVNHQAVRLLRYDNAEEVIGRNSLEFIAPEDRQRAAENALRTLQTGAVQSVEYTILRKDGTSFPAELSASSIVDAQGRPRAFTGVVRDITERKRAEDALREGEERFRTLSEATFEGIVIHRKGKILDANRTFAEMFGYELSEVVGMHPRDFAAPETRDLVLYAAVSRYEKPFEMIGLRKDGSTFLVEVCGKATQYRGHTVAVAAIRDITERKRVEEALRKAREDIESRVERRMQQVNGYGLTFRELAVLHLVAAGQADKEIATVLSISPLTAHKHIANILEKMGAASRTEAGVRALREGLLD